MSIQVSGNPIKCAFAAGHNGMVDSVIVRKLSKPRGIKVITASRSELNLLDSAAVNDFFSNNHIDQIYVTAKVGGVVANNNYSADFIYENLMIECNLINSAHLAGIQNLLLLGSSCIYPKFAKQSMK